MNWKKLMLKEMNAIEKNIIQLQQIDDSDDEEYQKIWDDTNNHFHWFLTRMEQWLGGIDTNIPYYHGLYEMNRKAHEVGQRTGIYWNVKAKRLFKEVQEMN